MHYLRGSPSMQRLCLSVSRAAYSDLLSRFSSPLNFALPLVTLRPCPCSSSALFPKGVAFPRSLIAALDWFGVVADSILDLHLPELDPDPPKPFLDRFVPQTVLPFCWRREGNLPQAAERLASKERISCSTLSFAAAAAAVWGPCPNLSLKRARGEEGEKRRHLPSASLYHFDNCQQQGLFDTPIRASPRPSLVSLLNLPVLHFTPNWDWPVLLPILLSKTRGTKVEQGLLCWKAFLHNRSAFCCAVLFGFLVPLLFFILISVITSSDASIRCLPARP